MPIPYVKPAYVDQSAARMSDLIRLKGATQANADRQQAVLNAGMWTSLADTAGRTMSDLIKTQAEKPTQDLRKAQTQRLMREERKAFEEDEIDRQTAGMAPEDAATIAEGYGHPLKADKIREQAMTLEEKRLKLEEFKGKRISDEFAKAGDVIRLAMSPEMPAEKKQALWTEGRTRLGKALDLQPEDLASIPELVPTDPAQLTNYLEMTMSARERLEAQAQAARALNESRKDDDAYAKYLSTYVAAATTPEEFNAVRELAQKRGKADLFETMFGQSFTPEAVAFAKRALGKPEPTDKTGTLADYLARGAAELGTTPEKLTTRQIDALTLRYNSNHPKSAGDGTEGAKPVSTAQRNEALSAKESSLKALQKAFVEANEEAAKATDQDFVLGKSTPTPESLAALDYGKLKAENTYREKLGLPPVTSLEEAGYGPSDKGPPPLSRLAKPSPVVPPVSRPATAPIAPPALPSTAVGGAAPLPPAPVAPPAPPAPRVLGEGTFSVRLGNGKTVVFPSKAAAQSWAADNGVVLK